MVRMEAALWDRHGSADPVGDTPLRSKRRGASGWRRSVSSAKKNPLREERVCKYDGGSFNLNLTFYDPFWQTDKDSPWKVNQSFTLVLGGAPK